jgi:hypothetical protein
MTSSGVAGVDDFKYGWLSQVRQGVGAMPSFSEQEINTQELNALVAFMSATGSPWGG